MHLHAIYIIAGPIDKTGMDDGSKKVNLRMGSGCDRLALENNCVTAGGLDDVPTKIFGRCLVRRVRTMFIDQRADSKWRINIGGKMPLSQVVQNVHKKNSARTRKVGMYGYVLQPVGGSVDLG